jgi:hypothetical protein
MKEACMAVVTDRTKFDEEIRAAKEAGMSHKDIAFALGVHKWLIDDASKRLNIAKRNHFSEIAKSFKSVKTPAAAGTCIYEPREEE